MTSSTTCARRLGMLICSGTTGHGTGKRLTLSEFVPDYLLLTGSEIPPALHDHSSATEWTLLRTFAGATDSPVRRDYPPPNVHAAELGALPGVLLVATQDDTILYGYGWNRLVALRSNTHTHKEMIRLNKVEMIMRRGDFIYATAGSESNNLVLHAYLDTPQYL
jgi:hypothetical protein